MEWVIKINWIYNNNNNRLHQINKVILLLKDQVELEKEIVNQVIMMIKHLPNRCLIMRVEVQINNLKRVSNYVINN